MTNIEFGGWYAEVSRAPLRFGLNVWLLERFSDAQRVVTGITQEGLETELHEPAVSACPLFVPDGAAEALFSALGHHLQGTAPVREARADLLHERDRVDRLIRVLSATALSGAELGGSIVDRVLR